MHKLREPAYAFGMDVLLVVVFATIGRMSHAEGLSVPGILGTAWPFLAGTVIGWGVVKLLRKDWPLDVGPGITVWFATLVFGMLLRIATGTGTAASFIAVAATMLALLLIGWRYVATRATGPARTTD